MLRLKMMILMVSFFTLYSSFAQGSYFDKEKKLVICKEALPEFTLSLTSKPNREQVKQLCSCIWNTFPPGGWEQRTSRKIRNRQDPGWRGRALISRFGKAMEKCGGYKL
jgi:hypothetical protein